jgi:hypothetical protein
MRSNLCRYASDITKLSIGPSTLDFGTVSALSTTTKYFAVTNHLSESILVQMDISGGVLKDSFPSSQVVPAVGLCTLNQVDP